MPTWTRAVYKNDKRPNWEWPHSKTVSISLSRGNKRVCPTGGSLSLFHINISSLGYHFHELEDLSTLRNTDFNIIGITESRLHNKKKSLISTSRQGYNIEHCPTESWNGGALLYIKK